ncbi:MAG: Gfo/Idh/MocA family oxidoreductase, partial [Oscillospiraceae bacterium]|nr:Gfo/Idh/MocA family oxidoreductase [Oscillospiraceae bacterium]
MNILFIGLGSVGKRHLRNAVFELTKRHLSYSIDALRLRGLPLERDIEKELREIYTDFEQIKTNYDAVFITNPSSAHYETLRRAAQFSKAVFIEKPV